MSASDNTGAVYVTAEEAGIVEHEFTPPGTLYKRDASGEWVPAITPSANHGPSNEYNSNPQAAFTPLDSSANVVPPVLKRMGEIKGMLERQGPRDPQTGEVTYHIGGRQREILEREYASLLHHTLPHQMKRGAAADAWLAANPQPGSESALHQQVLQRQAHQRRVDELVAEREAQEDAARIIALKPRG